MLCIYAHSWQRRRLRAFPSRAARTGALMELLAHHVRLILVVVLEVLSELADYPVKLLLRAGSEEFHLYIASLWSYYITYVDKKQ